MTRPDGVPGSDGLSEDDLRAILERSAAATAGPWESSVEGRDHTSGDSFIRRGGLDDSREEDLYITPWRVEDQDFIAAARQDIPRLVAEIRRLQRSRGGIRS